MQCRRFNKACPFFLGYLSGFIMSVYFFSYMSLVFRLDSTNSHNRLDPKYQRKAELALVPEEAADSGVILKPVTKLESEGAADSSVILKLVRKLELVLAGRSRVILEPIRKLETPLERYMKHVTYHSENVQCKKLFDEDALEIVRAEKYLKSYYYTIPAFPDILFSHVTRNCEDFIKYLGYNNVKTQQESDFPVAYTIMTHEKIEQVERLLRMVYSPSNLYCIHVDLKSSPEFVTSVTSLAKCFPNVFLTSRRESVVYASFSRLRGELNCMEDLLKQDKSWMYYLNLASSEIPLKSNLENVKILKSLNGQNDIRETYNSRMLGRFKYKYEIDGEWVQKTKRLHPLPPYNLTITKGLAYGAFSRTFLEFTMTNKMAKALLKWSMDTYSPDEHYWSTLNNLFHNAFLKTPGGSKAAPEKTRYISRFLKWKDFGPTKRRQCHGQYRHSICVFGFGDLPSISQQKNLAANKFDLEYDPIAYACAEELHRNRTLSQMG